jgi:hypothetical protein
MFSCRLINVHSTHVYTPVFLLALYYDIVHCELVILSSVLDAMVFGFRWYMKLYFELLTLEMELTTLCPFED